MWNVDCELPRLLMEMLIFNGTLLGPGVWDTGTRRSKNGPRGSRTNSPRRLLSGCWKLVETNSAPSILSGSLN